MTLKLFLSIAVGALLFCAIFWAWTPDEPREVLAAGYLKAPQTMLDVDGERLRVSDVGPRGAPAVIMLHGFGASLETWDAWAEGLETTYRVVRFDLPGSGLSLPDPDGDYTDARTLRILLALMDRLGVARASLIGHSIGGRMAWRFAAAHPERIDKLVLVAPDGFASPGFAYGQAPRVPASFELMRYVLPRPVLRSFLASAYADPAHLTDARMQRYGDLMRAPGSRQALLARMRQTVLVDPVPLLRTIRAPTLLVWGTQDKMIPVANAADYLRALPNARRLDIASAGHLVQEESPGTVETVAAFLAQ